jgi:hypothetical protein
MSILGFGAMNPATVMQMIDAGKWQVALYSGSQKTADEYRQFVLKRKKQKSHKDKAVQVVIGVSNLRKLARKTFDATLIFDAATNLYRLKEHVPTVNVVDLEKVTAGHYAPAPVTPRSLEKFMQESGKLPKKLPSFAGENYLASAAEILEMTSKLKDVDKSTPSGVRRLMQELLTVVGQKRWVQGTESYFVQYLFHLCNRSFVTSKITRKLPNKEAKIVWKRMLEFADSNVGYAMYSAYYKLCKAKDKSIGHDFVVKEFSLKNYAGDFSYAASIVPPSSTHEFLTDLGDHSRERNGDKEATPKSGKKKARKSGKKKARRSAKKKRS